MLSSAVRLHGVDPVHERSGIMELDMPSSSGTYSRTPTNMLPRSSKVPWSSRWCSAESSLRSFAPSSCIAFGYSASLKISRGLRTSMFGADAASSRSVHNRDQPLCATVLN